MLKVTDIIHDHSVAEFTLLLPFDERQKSRLRTRLTNGEEIILQLPRGSVLRSGDRLRAENGTIVEVHAAMELVSTVRTGNPTLLARAAYHLGNRHVPLQVGDGWLRYSHDHVLDDMLQVLGMEVIVEKTPFEPEAGAYHSDHGHSHQHESHE